ncbi:piggyBac transposable element-derived protein 4-like [Bradysia coprophila]|uniref:piggyBac transposable element-derived protein 4-like n=1 Tax=Bradysia coprophila TaxID=38358 RepID=UPI00187DD709|nr:piggyBac transposable element-derived protein 4-like [Bradysia coprophila]
MPKRKLEKDSFLKIIVNDDLENCEDESDCDHDEQSDSEEEHISEASEDDDDELSCESNIALFQRKLRVRYVDVVKLRSKQAKVPTTRRKIVNVSRKAVANNRKIQNVKSLNVKSKCINKASKSSQSSPQSNIFKSKDGTKWRKMPFPQATSRAKHNGNNSFDTLIIPQDVEAASPIDFFKLFFTDEVCDEILRYTNLEALRFYDSKKCPLDEWKLVDKVELHAFFGLLITAGHMKSCNENYRNFWHPFYGSTFFQATMGLTRFEQLLRFIRFDDKNTRSARRKIDKLCPIRDVWEKVTGGFKKYYIPSQNLTIDEQLMPCRCRCSFIQFMPKKPDKYGIKIFWICDSKTGFPVQGYVYTGKNGDKRTVDLARIVVETLCESFHGTNRNITTDNYFTSYPLAESLLSKGLTLVGTLKKNKTCVPVEFLPNKGREEGSTMFGFQKTITLVSHVPKVGKAVLFLSTMHHSDKVITDQVKKPISEINKFYNGTKGGVDTMDQMVHEYMTKRKTNRWPFAFFMNLLDVSNIAAFILWCKKFPLWNAKKKNKRNLFLRGLGEELVAEQIARREKTIQLRQTSREAIADYYAHVQGVKKVKGKGNAVSDSGSNDSSPPAAKRRRCHLCPSQQSKMQKQFCHKCYKNVCNNHSTFTRQCSACKPL